ncbi:MAG: TetR/AcrR family transcriptional regulator [Gammaproteobacteria bacterium]|nr:TetR/AcrR family transcriptional regulator [Gammaproteobacteria bacterium]
MGRKAHCRQHILQSGLEVLSAKGYNGTGVKEIVERAGVPKGSFYNHFDSKESFVIEALQMAAAQSLADARQLLQDNTKPPVERLIAFFSQQYQLMREQSFCGGCLVGNISLEMAGENDNLRATTNAIFEQYIGLLAEVIASAQQPAPNAQHTDPKALAEFIHCAWEGTLMRLKTSRERQPFDIFIQQIQQLLAD